MDREQLMQALRNAHAAGDASGAQRIAAMIQALPAATPAPAPTPVRTPAPVTQDPMLPSPDTDTRSTQEYLEATGQAAPPLVNAEAALAPPRMPTGGGQFGDILRSGAAGAARGVGELLALPDTIGGGLDWLYERAGLIPEGARQQVPSVGGAIRQGVADFTSGAPEYQPQTTAGEYASTVGEFVGGGAGPRVGTVAGLLSEGAGQATEGTALETPARIAGGVVGGVLGAPRPQTVSPRLMGEAADDANALMARGIQPTAGQVSDSSILARMEGVYSPTSKQLDDLTAAAMRTAGNTSATRATPTALRETSDAITGGMNDILRNVDVPVSSGIGQRVADIVDDYAATTAGGLPNTNARRIAEEIMEVATSPVRSTIPAARLREWRTKLGSLTTSSDEATRDIAHELREVIDDATSAQLTNLGRADDVAALGQLRNQYRNLLVITDASTRGGREGARGILTPERLATASQRTVGRTNYALGRGTDLSDLSLQSLRVLGSQPTVQAGGFRDIVGLSSLGLGGSVGLATQSVPMAAAAAALPPLAQSAMRSAPIQGLLTNPATVFGQASRVAPGLLAQ